MIEEVSSSYDSLWANRLISCLFFSWDGSYDGAHIQWTEYYGANHDHPFKYNGFIEHNRIWGTYKWTANNAVGSFDFQLERLDN